MAAIELTDRCVSNTSLEPEQTDDHFASDTLIVTSTQPGSRDPGGEHRTKIVAAVSECIVIRSSSHIASEIDVTTKVKKSEGKSGTWGIRMSVIMPLI